MYVLSIDTQDAIIITTLITTDVAVGTRDLYAHDERARRARITEMASRMGVIGESKANTGAPHEPFMLIEARRY